MPFADSQGATVMFGGRLLGSLVNIQATQSVAGTFDCTSSASPVLGFGSNSRVLKQLNPTSVDPGAVAIQFIGPAVFSSVDIGRVAMLSFSLLSGGSLVGYAFLENLELEAAVGEKLRGTATFKFVGFSS